MSDRFVALPVGRGDAFFYQRDNLKILVDGGNSAQKLPGLVNEHLGIKEIDILICTHNDADHANGLIGILDKEKWEGIIHEVWLPGSWSYKLKELLEDPDSFFIELAEDISQLPEQELFSLENLTILTNHDFERAYQTEEVSDELFVDLCTKGEGFSYEFYSHLLRLLKPSSRLLSQKTRQRLCLEAIDAASRIKEIARRAYSRGVKVRWFDFNEFERQGQQPHGGNRGILEPVNACEVLPTTRNITALQYLYLTVDNKRSLAFLSLEEDNRPGVLFTAESNFDFEIRHQSPSISMIVTVPHHGSEANKKVYEFVSDWHTCSTSLIWVRSDAKYKKRVGKSFLSVSGQRLCTICRPPDPNYPKQAVKLSRQKDLAQWNREQGVRKCQCQ